MAMVALILVVLSLSWQASNGVSIDSDHRGVWNTRSGVLTLDPFLLR